MIPKITVKHKAKASLKTMALSIRDYTIIQVVQVTHHQGDVRYGKARGIQCSCMYLLCYSVKSPNWWDKLDLDGILDIEDQLFKSLGKFSYLGMEDLPQEFLLEVFAVNVQFLEIKTGEITAGAYLLSIVEIVNSVQQIGMVPYLLLTITF